MSWLQVSCFLQSQIFTAVAVKSGPACKPAIHMGYAETAFPVVKYNFTYLYLPIPSLSIPDHLISAGVLSGIAILTKTGGNCVLSYGKLASHSDQARTDRHKSSSFCYWHQNICGLSSRIGISSRVCSLTQVKKYQVCQKDFYVRFVRAGINKPQAIKIRKFFLPTTSWGMKLTLFKSGVMSLSALAIHVGTIRWLVAVSIATS